MWFHGVCSQMCKQVKESQVPCWGLPRNASSEVRTHFRVLTMCCPPPDLILGAMVRVAAIPSPRLRHRARGQAKGKADQMHGLCLGAMFSKTWGWVLQGSRPCTGAGEPFGKQACAS